MTVIPHNRCWITNEDRAAVDAAMASGWIAPGPRVAALEQAFTAMLGGGAACAVSSGTAALFLALRGMGVGAGDQVAVPTYACSALLNAVAMAGAEARLVDVRPDTFTIDPALVPVQAPAARTVIAVHTYGATAEVAALKAQGLAVIEDCCQSLGGPQGRLGDAAVFSFYATKVVTGGHGGLVWSPDGAVAERTRDYVNFDGREDWTPRFNLQLTDIQAAMVVSQMSRLEENRRRRHALRATYLDAFPAGLAVQAGLDTADILPYRFVLLAEGGRRDRMAEAFAAAGIRTIVPIARFELLHRYLGMDPAAYPVAEDLADRTLSLPFFPALSDAEAGAVRAILTREIP